MALHESMATLTVAATPAELRRAWHEAVGARSDHELTCAACMPFALRVEGAEACETGRRLAEADEAAHAAWTRARWGGAS